jgi:hypothetical protein
MLLTVESREERGQWRCEVRGLPSGATVASYRATRDEAERCAIADALHLLAADLRQGLVRDARGGVAFVFVHGSSSAP